MPATAVADGGGEGVSVLYHPCGALVTSSDRELDREGVGSRKRDALGARAEPELLTAAVHEGR